ncbi:hypothetical protein ACS0TY_002773 [Phlomoides rotata]
MKLRLRSLQSKETLKIEVPDSCTLPQLKQILSETLPNSPAPASIRLSLNRKDELRFDNEESLQFLGIAAGDLIYFSVEQPAAFTSSNSQDALFPVTDSTPISHTNDSECSTRSNTQSALSDVPNSDSVTLGSRKGETLGTGSQMKEAVNDMEIDDKDGENSLNSDGLLEEVVDTSFSVPGFLRKVFAKELGDDDGLNHKLVVIAVHAVILESGFVGFDEKANKVVDGFQFRNEWPSCLFTLSLSYTLPGSLFGEAVKSIVLKFQSLGKFMNVYGTLSNGEGKRGVYSVRLNEDELVPFLNVVWANCGTLEYFSGKDGEVLDTSPEKEVFKFWRTVKDNLALPLLIDFCEEAGFELPPCLMRLPTELKLKILELLPGVDVAKVSCVCSEFRYLASSDDLWKFKLTEEFSNEKKEAHVSWKKAFSLAWSRHNGRKLASRVRAPPFWHEPYWLQSPDPFMVPRAPRFIGGDYDLLPPPFEDDLQRYDDIVYRRMRNLSPQCNLGVRGGSLFK